MKIFTLAAFLLLGSSLGAVEKSLLNELPQNGIQSAFQILRRDYIRREDLTFEELNRAALQGLLERLSFGAELVKDETSSVKRPPYVHGEFLAPNVAYLRPTTFQEGEGALFEKALTDLVEKKATSLILDLRSAGEGTFEEAALMVQCFIPQGEILFKMKQLGQEQSELFISKRDPLWTRDVVILIDEEVSNAGETIAACLSKRHRALLIGEKTRGATVRYTFVKLAEATSLRYASAEMLLPDDSSHFRRGIEPAFVVKADLKAKRQVFEKSREKSMKPYITDKVRPRFNEAALVAGGNPELDDYVRKSKGQPLPGDEGQLRDEVTQRALDVLNAGAFFSEPKIDWKAEAPSPKIVPSKP